MYDVVIVGNGPAGISCALTARRRNLKTAILSNSIKSNLLWKTDQIDNYPGMPMVSGVEMLETFEKQALDMSVEIKTGLVRQIIKNEDIFMLLQGDDIIESKAVVLCLGIAKPKYFDGESELIGNGISYCATCDAMFYKGKNIAVISENEDGVEEANFLNNVVGSIDYFSIKKHDLKEIGNN
ncbi:MAG: FAD-dependent oxidoreductase, partial [Christensenellaceae bacterium]|nr:FAD-dependent oxidoreductase [Christensenellaceae bacterium]